VAITVPFHFYDGVRDKGWESECQERKDRLSKNYRSETAEDNLQEYELPGKGDAGRIDRPSGSSFPPSCIPRVLRVSGGISIGPYALPVPVTEGLVLSGQYYSFILK
jgi:hypothetical protein